MRNVTKLKKKYHQQLCEGVIKATAQAFAEKIKISPKTQLQMLNLLSKISVKG